MEDRKKREREREEEMIYIYIYIYISIYSMRDAASYSSASFKLKFRRDAADQCLPLLSNHRFASAATTYQGGASCLD